ncbi:MAG: OmpA family protein [Methylophagaceae bacterium]
MLQKLIPFIFILFISAVQAEQFQAPFTDTHWLVVESPLECSLSQTITDFGEAKFIQSSGRNGELSLIFSTHSFPASESNVSFEIAEAPWQNSNDRLPLVSIPTAKNQTQFSISGDLAKQALTHIQEGRFPTIRYRSRNSTEQIHALLSTVHFSDSMPAFQQCLQNLSPYTFEDKQQLTLYFSSESAALSTANQDALTQLAEYVKIDDAVKRVVISGFTDNHGRKRLNIPLSEARAVSIKNFLVQQSNLPENLITTTFHREFKPAATNTTVAGRAINRRAEIKLLR